MKKKLLELTKFLFSKQNFEKVKTNSGEIEYDKLEVGNEIYEIVEGEPVLIETEKEFELEDGTKIKTDESGLISEIMKPEVEDTDEEDKVEIEIESKKEEMETIIETQPLLDQLEELPTECEKPTMDYEKEINLLKEKLDEVLNKLSVIVPEKEAMEAKFSKITEELEVIKNTPIFNKEEIKVEKQNFNKQDDFKNYLMNLKNQTK